MQDPESLIAFSKIRRSDRRPLIIGCVYLVSSTIWLIFADRWMTHLSADPEVLTRFGMLNILLYISVTTGLIYILLHSQSGAKQRLEETIVDRTAALRESEAQYELLFDSNPLPMWVFHRETLKFLAINEAALHHYLYSRAEIFSMTILDLLTPEEKIRILQQLSKPSQQLQETQTWRHRKKDKSFIDVDITARDVNFRGEHAQLILAHDVTERRKGQERLLQSQERFAKAFRSSPFGITICSEKESRYLDVNPAFLKIMGYERDEVVGKTVKEVNAWADLDQRTLMLDQLNSSERATPSRVRFKTSSGKHRTVEVAVERIHLDDEPCILAIIHDVTEATRLEQQLLQSQKMEAVGRLAGGIAHDFSNMLGVIIGYCQITKERLEAQHSAQKYLQEIRTAADRAVALTRQLLTFSRLQVLEPRNLNLNSVVHHISKMLRHMIGEDITLVLRPAEPLSSVRADLGQIEQVLMNLVVNSRDAMPKGGRIVIETANVDLDDIYARDRQPIKPGPYVMLSVTDTGEGMDEATVAQAFEPFFTTKESGKGTGLGLSTVYGIVNQSGGHIWVYSEPGRGTTFKVYLPSIDQPAEILAPAKSDADSPHGTETVLVVEDEPALRKLTVRVLKSRGYQVLSAENATSTLELVRKYDRNIDLLLTDVVMPDLTGPDLASQIRKFRPELKVLYMSGYSRNVMVQQGLLEPDSTLIVKPFSATALLAKMRAVLGTMSVETAVVQ